MSQEKKVLLDNEEGEEEPSPPYGTAAPDKPQPSVNSTASERPTGKITGYLYDHRASIPGYGMVRMLKGVSAYSLYVLLALLMAYLLNQLDRYTLPIVTSLAGYDLNYGTEFCMANKHLSAEILEEFGITKNITDICKSEKYYYEPMNMTLDIKSNATLCLNLEPLVFYNESDIEPFHVCEFHHSGTGLLYQLVAGPVFNNLYILAGIFTGFLADYGRRTVWLVISLFSWSVVTGLTGFARTYWHLVVLRALLAIGAAGCTPFAVSLIGDYFPPEFRGTAISVYYWGIYFGYSLAFAIGNSIKKVLSWRWVFFLSAIAGIIVAPLILFTVKEPKRTKNILADKSDEKNRISLYQRFIMLARTFIMPGMFTLCIAGGVRNAGGYVWAYNTEVFFELSYTSDHISYFMSWIPLIGGSIGAVVGGIISDILVKGRGPYMRIWVLIFSQILAAPFAAGALFLPSPWCFLSLIPSNVIGEMWIGVTTAIIVDLAPSKVRTAAVAIYLFIITVIGGNFNLIVAPIHSGFKHHFDDLTSYRWALFFTFPGVYAISSFLFLLAFFFMRLDLMNKASIDNTMTVNATTQRGQDRYRDMSSEDEEEEEPRDKADGIHGNNKGSQLETSYSESDFS